MNRKEGLQPSKKVTKTKGGVALWTDSRSTSSFPIEYQKTASLSTEFCAAFRRYLLHWLSGLSGVFGMEREEQEPLHTLMKEILLFSLSQELLEKVLPPEKELVVGLVEEIKTGFDKLIKALAPEKYPKARTCIENFALRVSYAWI